MRLAFFIAGLLVMLMGTGWALQGAYVVPATFMRGPEWIAIGAAVAGLGGLLVWRSFAKRAGEEPPTTPSP